MSKSQISPTRRHVAMDMKQSSMLKDSEKKYKEGMRMELQFENGTVGGEMVLIRPLLCKETGNKHQRHELPLD